MSHGDRFDRHKHRKPGPVNRWMTREIAKHGRVSTIIWLAVITLFILGLIAVVVFGGHYGVN